MKSIHLSLFVVLCFTLQLVAQQSVPNLDLQKKLQVDPNVEVGTFKNGLKYYIRQNHKPENRVELRLDSEGCERRKQLC